VPAVLAFVHSVTAAATGAIAGAVIVLARRSLLGVPTILIARDPRRPLAVEAGAGAGGRSGGGARRVAPPQLASGAV